MGRAETATEEIIEDVAQKSTVNDFIANETKWKEEKTEFLTTEKLASEQEKEKANTSTTKNYAKEIDKGPNKDTATSGGSGIGQGKSTEEIKKQTSSEELRKDLVNKIAEFQAQTQSDSSQIKLSEASEERINSFILGQDSPEIIWADFTDPGIRCITSETNTITK